MAFGERDRQGHDQFFEVVGRTGQLQGLWDAARRRDGRDDGRQEAAFGSVELAGVVGSGGAQCGKTQELTGGNGHYEGSAKRKTKRRDSGERLMSQS